VPRARGLNLGGGCPDVALLVEGGDDDAEFAHFTSSAAGNAILPSRPDSQSSTAAAGVLAGAAFLEW
jgi:hypothetical protein